MRIHTAVTRLLGIDLPLLLRGPAAAAAAASEAGAYGILTVAPDLPAASAAIDEARAGTSRPFGVFLAGITEAVLEVLFASPATAIVTTGRDHHLSARIRAAGKRHLHEASLAAPDGLDSDAVLAQLDGWTPLHANVPLVATRLITGAQLAAALALGAAAAEIDPAPGEQPADAIRRIVAEYAATVRALPLPSGPPPRDPGRAVREAAALRENLRRRKDQLRVRTQGS